jgi:hypothetical protein
MLVTARALVLLVWFLVPEFCVNVSAQATFPYEVSIEPRTINNLPAIHAYAHAQDDGKWLVLGGRRDGLHARQPFNAFPLASNNDEIFVVDPVAEQVWSANLSSLPESISEQLQSTNLNFHQKGDYLYIAGGYAYAPSAGDHITFPYLTAIQVPELIAAIVAGETDLSPFVFQIENDFFALTGGCLVELESTFYLAGGHRFDGRYNPMGNPTFIQTYSNAIRMFSADVVNGQLIVGDFSEWVDPVHLRRRDYNLLPQVFADGTLGFTLFSGVFQMNADLPFLYPVDFTAAGYTPRTEFNQYLNHYHSASVALWEGAENTMHNLFFGGMSQFYFVDGAMVEDQAVPFVSTIGLVTRDSANVLSEAVLPLSLPGLEGASAEFILAHDLPTNANGCVNLDAIEANEFTLGYIYGGIRTTTLNPFSVNQTNTTSADDVLYEVKLVRQPTAIQEQVVGKTAPELRLSPNPAVDQVSSASFTLSTETEVVLLVSTLKGELIMNAPLGMLGAGEHSFDIEFDADLPSQVVLVTAVFGHQHYITQRLVLNR